MTWTKSLFNLRLTIDTIKRKWWLFVVNAILLFFAGPVAFLLGTHGRISYLTMQDPVSLEKGLRDMAENFFSRSEFWMFTLVILIFISVISSIVTFSYLHSKKQIHFYHSQPVTREDLFTANTACGVLLFVAPLLLNILILLVCAAANGVLAYVDAAPFLSVIAYLCVFYLLFYAIGVLCAHLCGTIFAQICGIVVLNGFAGCFMLVITAFKSLCYWGYYPLFVETKGDFTAPIVRAFIGLGENEARGVSCQELVIYLVIALVLFALSLLLYRGRRSERAGTPLVFNVSRPIIKYPILFLAASGMGLFFYSLGGFVFMLFGMIAGALLCHMVCEVIFSKDFRKMFAHMIGFGIFCVVYAVFFCGLIFDWTGYNRYVPSPGDVDSILFQDATSSGFYYQYEDLDTIIRDNKLNYSNPEDINTILDMCTRATDYKNEQVEPIYLGLDGQTVYSDVAYYSPSENTTSFNVVFQLKNGRQVVRAYNGIPFSRIREQYAALYDSNAYKQKQEEVWSFLDDPSVTLSGSLVYSVAGMDQQTVYNFDYDPYSEQQSEQQTEMEKYRVLMEAIRKDTMNRTFADIQNSRPAYTIVLRYMFKAEDGSQRYSDTQELTVFTCDSETIRVLKEQFNVMDPEIVMADYLEQVSEVRIARFDSGIYNLFGEEQEGILVITDRNQIREVFNASITELQMNMDRRLLHDTVYQIEARVHVDNLPQDDIDQMYRAEDKYAHIYTEEAASADQLVGEEIITSYTWIFKEGQVPSFVTSQLP